MDLSMESIMQFCDLSTIAVALVCKIPQIMAILKSKNVEGISESSVLVELIGYSIILCYNIVKEYAYMSYLEYFFLVAQDIVLLLLILKYRGTLDTVRLAGLGLLAALFYGFTIGIPRKNVMDYIVHFVTPCSASSKLVQIFALISSKNSEAVSVLTWLIAAYTSLTRVMSTYLTTGDISLLVNFSVAFTLNLVVITLSLFYKKSSVGSASKIKSKSNLRGNGLSGKAKKVRAKRD